MMKLFWVAAGRTWIRLVGVGVRVFLVMTTMMLFGRRCGCAAVALRRVRSGRTGLASAARALSQAHGRSKGKNG